MKNRQTLRLTEWDYRWEADYFITICTKDFKSKFGKIENGKMTLSHIGIIAELFWYQIPTFKTNISLGTYVIMPNHLHGILQIRDFSNKKDTQSLIPPQIQSYNKSYSTASPKEGSISAIVRSYKSAVTKHARRLGYSFEWQPKFYDHIIRDGKDFVRIENYIDNNIENWNKDRFFK
ncbi:transposase [Flammeovirga sp. OC4]|uniref:transposase n=1 Tax=Flammeovirga sp. OC4 TaxID=1382345 RepID=UPI0005C57208|nr:transposase [Flammeovirga sp. OC4]